MNTSKPNFYFSLSSFSILLFLLIFPIAKAEVCPTIGHPKDFTAFLADPYDTQPINGRTPLILVHGIDGNKFPGGADEIGNPYWDYWLNFRMFFNSWGASGYPLLKEDFKLYAFFYESNKICVDDIAKGLRDWIDERTNQPQGTANKLEDVPFVIVAHSMGGLVSRAFMNNTVFNIGNFAGQAGGNRVIRLITLGTPHHGSIAANGTTTDGCLFEESAIWSKDYVFIGILKWWNFRWWDTTVTNIGDPNRNDLLWDNFNESINDCSHHDSEVNDLLTNKLLQTDFDNKIIAYGGKLSLSDPERPTQTDFSDSDTLVRCPVGLFEFRNEFYSRYLWLCSSVLLYEGLTNPSDYGLNDGIVPIRSALFEGHSLAGSHELSGFDHGQIRGTNLYPGDFKYYDLFNLLENDLSSLAFGFGIDPTSPHAPIEVTFSPTGPYSDSASYQWTFYEGPDENSTPTYSNDKSPPHLYLKSGEYLVKLEVTDPATSMFTRSRVITVAPPEINVS